jgi:flavin-dependent dehydrogenase
VRTELPNRALHAVEMHLWDADLHFTVRRPEPVLFTTMRADLDARLCDGARRAGAEVRAPCTVRGLRSHAEGVELHTDSGPLHGRFVIAADGAASRLARWAGWPEVQCIPAIEWEVQADAAALSRYGEAARFDFGLVPWGYAWVFPKSEHLSAGILSLERGALQLQERLKRYLHDLAIADAQVERHGALIPVAPRAGPFLRNRVLLCGDAAGLVDPLTCEGISYALQSGQLAADALLAAEMRPYVARERYDAALGSEVLPELRWARMLCKLLYRSSRVRSWLFHGIGQTLCETMADVIGGRRTYREILGPPSNQRDLLRRLSRARQALAHR